MVAFLADFAAGRPDVRLSRVFLVGDDNRSSSFQEHYGDSLPAPAELVSVAGSRVADARNLTNKGHGNRFADTYRALFAVDSNRVPRLQPEAILRRRFRAAFYRARLRRLAVLLLMVVVAQPAFEWSRIYRLDANLVAARQRIAALRPSVDRLLSMQQEFAQADASETRFAGVLDVLVEICSVKPSDVHFASIHYKHAERVSLRGWAQSLGGSVRFVKLLEELPLQVL
jgi:hypothetical protein